MSVIDNFFSGLEKNKIQYIIFKNIDRIDESLSFEFNFDISINPKHKNNFYKYIKNYQIFEGVNIYDFMNINTEHYFLYEKGRFYHLHIHFGLILGSALFGIGWGLGGLCPGPAVAILSYSFFSAIFFMIAMLIGLFVGKKFLI